MPLFLIFDFMSKYRSFIYNFAFFLCFSVMLSSCSSDSGMASSFGKRKYTKGYYLNTTGRIGDIIPVSASTTPKANMVAEQATVIINRAKQVIPIQSQTVSSVSVKPSAQVKSVTSYPKSKADFTSMGQSVKMVVRDTVQDSNDDGYKKEQRTNRVLGIIGFTTAVAGAVFLFIPEFVVAAILLAAGFIISAIGIRRGSNSLLAFFGFVVSILGILALLDILIVVKQG